MAMTDIPLLTVGQHIMTADAATALPREQLHPGVTYSVLWRDAGSLAGLMWVAAGGTVPQHVHERATHHAWLIDGRARIDDRVLESGSYWHVPAGVPHAVEGLAPSGCELFYLYLRGA
jgi:quercetin dioxygenase-like cupin family protein